jgi:hypothetical protein
VDYLPISQQEDFLRHIEIEGPKEAIYIIPDHQNAQDYGLTSSGLNNYVDSPPGYQKPILEKN